MSNYWVNGNTFFNNWKLKLIFKLEGNTYSLSVKYLFEDVSRKK